MRSSWEVGNQRSMTETTGPLPAELLDRIDAYWRAANYLSVGQIYLLDNPLLRQPLRPAHIKPRLLGHWGTTPPPGGGAGLSYVPFSGGVLAAGSLPPLPGTRTGCGCSSASSRFRAAS